jgi:hypothetical protein
MTKLTVAFRNFANAPKNLSGDVAQAFPVGRDTDKAKLKHSDLNVFTT